MEHKKIVWITLGALAVLILIVSAIVIVSARQSAGTVPAPVAPVEHEDCDAEDRAKKQWWECGPGVLAPTAKPPAPRTTKPRSTRR